MTKFYKLVPDMAIEFPFELDKFQKEVSCTHMHPFLFHCILHILHHPSAYTAFFTWTLIGKFTLQYMLIIVNTSSMFGSLSLQFYFTVYTRSQLDLY